MNTSRDSKEQRSEEFLRAEGLTKLYPVGHSLLRRQSKAYVRAVDGVDITIDRGETVALVGESGSGKSTVARLLVRLVDPTSGRIVINGRDVTALRQAEFRQVRRHIQMVFQDPYSSFDPSSTVLDSVSEPLMTHEKLNRHQARDRVSTLLDLVGLFPEHADRHPQELSGGQLQRAAVARALTVDPDLVVLDEPISSLDVSIQAQVISLLEDLQERLGLSYLFISHDLSVVHHMSDRIAVMHLGRVVEEGPADAVYDNPTHPYTMALLSAVPVPHPQTQRTRRRIVLAGDPPSPLAPPSGCRFHTRCPFAMEVCRTVDPTAFVTPQGSTTYCHLHTTGPTLAGAPVSQLSPP